MFQRKPFFFVLLGVLGASVANSQPLPLSTLHDKIAGGWAGQMIGVSFGAPTEFRFLGKINDAELPRWTRDSVKNALQQDDLYVDMTFAQVLDEKGLDATTEDFGAMFREARYALWHANLAARRNLKRGVPAHLAGTPQYNAHFDDIDFQIEADFIGLMAPGLPRAATEIAYRAGRVMNSGDGIRGGVFMSCMYAAAFFETDVRKVVEAGLACLPRESGYARIIADVLAWSRQYPDDWKKAWQLIEDKWHKREACPEGALKPFNIDAKFNGAYVALGLLYGQGDFTRTLEVSTRAGQDSDCNPATAAGILGTMLGYDRIPQDWKQGIPPIANEKFQFTGFTFHTIVASTEKRAIALVQRHGGRLEGDKLFVKKEVPRPHKGETTYDAGDPIARIGVTDSSWTWKGDWQSRGGIRVASTKDAEVSIAFDGTGAILTGPYLPTGGKADVYLDGRLHKTVDVYPDEDRVKGGEAVWHVFGLQSGRHTVRLVVRGEPYPGSKGNEIGVQDLVVFR